MQGPIGIFDSGYGGLTVLKAIKSKLPEYDYLYLGDNARAPYGTRSFEVVYQYTLEAVHHLFNQGCPLVILACNTASAKALRSIQQQDLPNMTDPSKRVLGVIRPSTEIIGELSKTNHVGVFATNGTVKSDSYRIEIEKFHPEVQVTQEACPMWVPLVENNAYQTEGGDYFIQQHVNNLFKRDKNIDSVILGCTHYPLLIEQINKYVPNGTKVYSQGEIVATSLEDYLKRHPEMDNRLRKSAECTYTTTENEMVFAENASLFLGESIQAIHTTISSI